MFLLIVLGRFLYVPFVKSWDVKFENLFFGFSWLSSFMQQIGNEIAWLSMGIFLFIMSKHVYLPFKKTIQVFATVVSVTALYFLSWTFYDGLSFSFHTEIFVSAITAISTFGAFWLLYRGYQSNNDIMKRKVRMLLGIIMSDSRTHVKDQWAYQNEIIDPTLEMLSDDKKMMS